ncbi:hypothetical protein GQ457_05G003840 [Hibiscus cannabinus]
MAIKACVSLMDLEMGEEIRRKAVAFGYQNDVFVASSVLNLYVKFLGCIDFWLCRKCTGVVDRDAGLWF